MLMKLRIFCHILQILAHHPDFPAKEMYLAEPELLQPFSCMLQFALQTLLLSPNGPAKTAGESISHRQSKYTLQ